jgi:hypothetical protein
MAKYYKGDTVRFKTPNILDDGIGVIKELIKTDEETYYEIRPTTKFENANGVQLESIYRIAAELELRRKSRTRK